MRIFVVRHAESEPPSEAWSEHDRPLTATGHTQAACLASAMRGEQLDRVICSTMRRAVQTAVPLARALGLPLIPEPDLVEIDLGALAAWEPKDQAEWERITATWARGDLAASCPGGESLLDVRTRVEPAVTRLVAQPCEHGIAIVAHAVVNEVIVPLLCPELRPAMGTYLGHGHTGVWELAGAGSAFRVLRRNDMRHLVPGPSAEAH